MGDKSKIEWTDASWNPLVGCSLVSPGCTHCYAMKQAHRIQAMTHASGKQSHYDGTTQLTKGGPVWTGKVALAPDRKIMEPLRWSKPRAIFVNSMGDLFHEEVPDEWIDQVFAVMTLAPQHTFQVLTKRAGRMREYFRNRHDGELLMPGGGPHIERELQIDKQTYRLLSTPLGRKREEETGRWLCRLPLPNVWLGVSAEDQKRADERIPDLLATPAAVRFVSAEPLLGPIDLTQLDHDRDRAAIEPWDALRSYTLEQAIQDWGEECEQTRDWPALDWVVAGGESGPSARPMHPDWARGLRDQCAAAGVRFFFKQWGNWEPCGVRSERAAVQGNESYRRWDSLNASIHVSSKRAAGRLLDGREHNEMPERANG